MKKTYLLLLSIIVFYVQLMAQNESYRGGSSDGYARNELMTAFAFPNSFAPFRGGSSDGYAKIELVTPFAFANNFAPFIGGTSDGYAGISLINMVFPFPSHFSIYLGGTSDGWAGHLQQSVIILPITLFQFRGEDVNGMHKLFWATSTELNSSHFEIERSGDGTQFLYLSRLDAKGTNSNRTEYVAMDSVPLKGKNFYRLKMIDKDGSFKYSPVILLAKADMMISMTIYPVPVKQMLQVRIND
ncbi:MAG TPA: hypothetical protein VGB71_06090, partial [Flavisolibacter sp.]